LFKRIFKYCQLSWGLKILLVQAFMLLGFVRLAIMVIPFRFLALNLGKQMQEAPEDDYGESDYVHQISWAIQLVSRYTPWESKCLVQAITGKIFLRQRRLNNTLYLGVAKSRENKMVAHAWLFCGKSVVTGAEGSGDFTVVGKFADIAR